MYRGVVMLRPRDLDGTAALIAAGRTRMAKASGERDTEFVKRVVCAYVNALPESNALYAAILTTIERTPS